MLYSFGLELFLTLHSGIFKPYPWLGLAVNLLLMVKFSSTEDVGLIRVAGFRLHR